MLNYLCLETYSTTEVTREGDPEDRWDRDDTLTSWDVHGLILTNKDGYKSLPAENVQVGDTIYVLYAVYSTADSFGQDDGAELEFISYHKTEELAQQNKLNIEQKSAGKDNFQMEILLDNGNKIKRFCPWDGYFESLDYIEVKEFVVA